MQKLKQIINVITF